MELLRKITSIDDFFNWRSLLGRWRSSRNKKWWILKIHSDFYFHQKLKIDRRLNLLLYLNDDWKHEFGGHLELWDKTMKKCEKKIELKFNKLYIFSTDNYSFHGYPDPIKCPSNISRKSLALYYYSNGRPNRDQKKEIPNTTNWKNRFNVKDEVNNSYSFKDYLRKFPILRKIKKNLFQNNLNGIYSFSNL